GCWASSGLLLQPVGAPVLTVSAGQAGEVAGTSDVPAPSSARPGSKEGVLLKQLFASLDSLKRNVSYFGFVFGAEIQRDSVFWLYLFRIENQDASQRFALCKLVFRLALIHLDNKLAGFLV